MELGIHLGTSSLDDLQGPFSFPTDHCSFHFLNPKEEIAKLAFGIRKSVCLFVCFLF